MKPILESCSSGCPGKRAEHASEVCLTCLTAVFALCLLSAPSSTYGAFELKPLPPAERGSATALADGIPRGDSASVAGCHGRPGLRSVEVYGYRPFGLGEISFVGTSAEVVLGRNLTLSLSYQALSALSYMEQTCAVMFGWHTGKLDLEPTLRVGAVGLDHSTLDHALLFDIACHARVVPEIEIFIGASNPFGLGLVRAGERCPVGTSAGLGYNVSEMFTFGIEVSKEAGFPTSVATGVEIRLAGGIKLRSGVRSDPKEFSMGLGLRLGRMEFDIASSLHLDLGVTHEAGLAYRRD